VSFIIICAIFASCITISGVYLTNKYHERRQKSEQNFTLKKEVFLDVAKSFANNLILTITIKIG
jgi:hypothetical protein